MCQNTIVFLYPYSGLVYNKSVAIIELLVRDIGGPSTVMFKLLALGLDECHGASLWADLVCRPDPVWDQYTRLARSHILDAALKTLAISATTAPLPPNFQIHEESADRRLSTTALVNT